VLAGLAFIVPAVVIVLALAWAYVEFGDRPAVEALLYGIGPVLVAIVARALLSLGRRAVAGPLAIGVFGGALGLYLAGVDEIVILVAAGIATAGARGLGARFGHWTGVALASDFLWSQAGRAEVELDTLFLVFLKIGSVLYGSGYVLLAFLRTDLVEDLGWLSGEQLVDAVAIGQMTPGPLFSTATFAGYVAAGLPGAALATVGIFLPSFLLIALVAPLAARARSRGWAAAVLDGVNVGALGLMAGVTLELAITAVVDVPAAALAALAGVALLRYDVNPTWLIAGGAAAGAALSFR
jgi:chromate transporter